VRNGLLCVILSLGSLEGRAEVAPFIERCSAPAAQSLFEKGFSSLQARNATDARARFEECLKAEPECVACWYERGWAAWIEGRWAIVVESWEKALKLDPEHPKVQEFLPAAQENLDLVRGKGIENGKRRASVPIGARSQPDESELELKLIGRIQSYNAEPTAKEDLYDLQIQSPKSASISPDGARAYIESLEAHRTLTYDALTLQKLQSVHHAFTPAERKLFQKSETLPNRIRVPKRALPEGGFNAFLGKPVESAFSHGGRYLWIPYYRRSFDKKAVYASAIGIIDTHTHSLVRVMQTGPIAKYALASPDNKILAVSNWGDNTVSLIAIGGEDPKKFRHLARPFVEKPLDLKKVSENRDKDCGFCLRGLEFSPDSKTVFVTRMGGGGIAAFDLTQPKKPKYLGTLKGVEPNPRDLLLSPDGKWMYSSCNSSGFVSRMPYEKLVQELRAANGQTVERKRKELGVERSFVGLGARSIRLSPDGAYLYVSVNQASELVAVRTSDMRVIARAPSDSYPVGLGISPDGSRLWVTAQARGGVGGNSVTVYSVQKRAVQTAEGAHGANLPTLAPRTPAYERGRH
jgi:DNA-binding beta-propeller fold protein YncE